MIADQENETTTMDKIDMAPCPCGATIINLMLETTQGSKVGRATCATCGVWGVDFLMPRTKDQDIVAKAATKAWNEAPRQ